MEIALTDKTVIVTGGASGLGAAYVKAFADANAKVAIADVQRDLGKDTAQQLVDRGAQAIYVDTDVSNETSTAAMAESVLGHFGSIDVLVNNAALYMDIEKKRPFDEISLQEWDRMMAINVRGVWLCTKAVVGVMRSAGHGKIVNVASSAFHAGVPNYAHYAASKGAVVALTRAFARELGAYRINVNAIAPGLIDNAASRKVNPSEYMERAPTSRAIARHMTQDDVVGTVLFLSSHLSDFMTGQTLVVDGGSVMQ
jgi:NAD(P)-dependent dehydrogenase (short-subunit alcohol dehydrogenase family)